MDPSEYYDRAYSRNRGLISEEEQKILKNTRVAIPGMGGMGGLHAATMARTGIGKYTFADFDEFDVHNTNRQYGAFQSTVGKPKAEVMERFVKDINPSAHVRVFNVAIDEGNVDDFLEGADVVIDSLDIFAMGARRLIYRNAREKGIPVLFTAPIGFSAAAFHFSPAGMSCDDFFGFRDDMPNNELVLLFLAGIAGTGPHLRYMDVKKIDPTTGGAPSVGLACNIGAGMVAAEVVNIMLKKTPVKCIPRFVHYDPIAGYYKNHHRRWGAKNPVHRLRLKVLRRMVPALSS
ncbi:MAG TPA: ThiF family adenylyltransferase [Rhodobacteraceae bacterium]|nr:ThiF family adenylyltransferase [Paracoccaceae bacterium]